MWAILIKLENKEIEGLNMPTNEGIPTWEDFPQFYNNPFVKQIAKIEKWTVSDKDKRPIDMHALIHEQKVWGMSFDRGYNPLVNLKTLCDVIPSAKNNAFYLDAIADNFVVLDIEPTCPDIIKRKFLELPYLYGETSMSGKGLHLVFELPKHILEKYPNAKNKIALKDGNGHYEILLYHMITFTRNVLPPSTYKEDIAVFENIFELLAMQAKDTSTAQGQKIEDIDTTTIPHFEEIVDELETKKYGKTAYDFVDRKNGKDHDHSAFEFGATGFYYRALNKLIESDEYKNHEYTDEEKAIILYTVTSRMLPERAKHETIRNGMPWLLFVASQLIAKSD